MIEYAVRRATAVVEAVAPDLNGRPFYIVSPPHLPRELFRGCLGFARRGMDRTMETVIEASQQWRGPGVAVAIDLPRIFDAASHWVDRYSNAQEYYAIGAALHEIAHVLCWPDETADALNSFDDSFSAFEESTKTPLPTTEAGLLPVELDSHGKDFIRICAHLWFRAGRLGWCKMDCAFLVFGACYRGLTVMSDPQHYCDALADECEATLDMPIREAVSRTPPDAFTSIWKRDVKALIEQANEEADHQESMGPPRTGAHVGISRSHQNAAY